MRLSTIAETPQQSISILRRAGVDIRNPAVAKLLRAEPSSHKRPGDEQNELKTLLDGSRLVVWGDPADFDAAVLQNLKTMPYRNNHLIFKPENLDVAQLLVSVPNTSPASDVLNGLAFGYGHKKTVPWAQGRQLSSMVSRWLLDNFGFDAHRVVQSGDQVVVTGLGIKELGQKLNQRGVRTSVPTGTHPDYGLAFRIPRGLSRSGLGAAAPVSEDVVGGVEVTTERAGDQTAFHFVLDGQEFVVDVIYHTTPASYFERDGIESPADVGQGRVLEAHFRAVKDRRATRAVGVRTFALFTIISEIILAEIRSFQPEFFLTTVGIGNSQNDLTEKRRAIYRRLLAKIGKPIDPKTIVGGSVNTSNMIAAKIV